MDEQEFHKRASQYIKAPIPSMKAKLQEFLTLCTYVDGQYDQDDSFQTLEHHLAEIEESYTNKNDPKNRVFYMALPPSVFTTVASHLKKNNYSKGAINRIIVEKPFGKDLQSSREMQVGLKACWGEDEVRYPSLVSFASYPKSHFFSLPSLHVQPLPHSAPTCQFVFLHLDKQIFRIDHYLGKEMVKNLLVLRFANVMLDASFNKNLISNVQITFKEPFGTEGRGGYFDEFGIIRDVMQNRKYPFPAICRTRDTRLMRFDRFASSFEYLDHGKTCIILQ